MVRGHRCSPNSFSFTSLLGELSLLSGYACQFSTNSFHSPTHGFTYIPVALDKTTASGGDNWLLYTSCAMQGWREGMSPHLFSHVKRFQHPNLEMEDELTVILPLHDELDKNNAFFAVYDGHAGGYFHPSGNVH